MFKARWRIAILILFFGLIDQHLLIAQENPTPPVDVDRKQSEAAQIENQLIQEALKQSLQAKSKEIIEEKKEDNVVSESPLPFAKERPDQEQKEYFKQDYEMIKDSIHEYLKKVMLSNDYDYFRDCSSEPTVKKYDHQEYVDVCVNLSSFFYSDDYIKRIQVQYKNYPFKPQIASLYHNKEKNQICFRNSLEVMSTVEFFFPRGLIYLSNNDQFLSKCSSFKTDILLDEPHEVYQYNEKYKYTKKIENNPYQNISFMLQNTEDKNNLSCFSLDTHKFDPYNFRYSDSENASDYEVFVLEEQKQQFLDLLEIKEKKLNEIEYLTEHEKTFDVYNENEKKNEYEYEEEYESKCEECTDNEYKNISSHDLKLEFVIDSKKRITGFCLDLKEKHSYLLGVKKGLTFKINEDLMADYHPTKSIGLKYIKPTKKESIKVFNTKFMVPYQTKEIPIFYKNINKLYAKLYKVEKSNLVHLTRSFDFNRPSRLKSKYPFGSNLSSFHSAYDYRYGYVTDLEMAENDQFIDDVVKYYGSEVWHGEYDLPTPVVDQESKANLPIPINLAEHKDSFFFLVLQNHTQHLLEPMIEKEKASYSLEIAAKDQVESFFVHLRQISDTETDAEVLGPAHSRNLSVDLNLRTPHRLGINEKKINRIQEILWIIPSHIGLQSFETSDGHHVKALALEKQEPLENIEVSVLANNNRVLTQQKTDKNGNAFFPKSIFEGKNGNKAVMITAMSDVGELSILSLRDHLITDQFKKADDWKKRHGMLFLNRGIYRLDEDVQVLLNVRGPSGKGSGTTVLLQMISALGFFDEGEYTHLIDSYLAKTNEVGVLEHVFHIPQSALSGDWLIRAYDYQKLKEIYPAFNNTELQHISNELDAIDLEYFKEALLDEESFQVDYLKPAEFKIKTEIINQPDLSQPSAMTPNYEVQINGSYHFGGFLDQVRVETDLFFVKVNQPRGFKKDGFVFGTKDEQQYANLNILNPITLNAEGKAVLNIPSVEKPDSLSPRELRAKLRVFENGNVYEDVIYLPANLRESEIGIRFVADRINIEDTEQIYVDIVTTNYKGEALPHTKLNVVWERYNDSQDNYYYEKIHDESITTNEKGEYILKAPFIDYGRYRISVINPKDGAVTSTIFDFEQSDIMIQDYLTMHQYEGARDEYGLPQKSSNSLVKALNIRAIDGKVDLKNLNINNQISAELEIAADGYLLWKMTDQNTLIWEKEYRVSQGKITENITIPTNLEVGVNLFAIFIRDSDPKFEKLPKRMIFQKWIPLKTDEFKGELVWDLPKQIESQRELEINYEIKNLNTTENMYISFWLVDNAILEYTNYQLKNLLNVIFSPKSISTRLYDIYNHVLEQFDLPKAELKFGGDLYIDMESMKDNDKILSERTGLLKVPLSGKGKAVINIPKFKGKARLTAYVFGEKKFIAKEDKIVVRNEVIVDVIRPDFMTLNDEAIITLNLHSFSEKDQKIKLSIKSTNHLNLKAKTWDLNMKYEQKFSEKLKVKLNQYGEAKITTTVEIDGKKPMVEEFTIQSRAPWGKDKFKQSFFLEPNQTQTIDLFKNKYTPQTTALQITLANQPVVDITSILNDLNEYPYGCGEQIVSKVFPQLYFDQLSSFYPDFKYDATQTQKHIISAIHSLNQLVANHYLYQYWIHNDYDEVSMDLSVYVLHFLMQAIQNNKDLDQYLPKGTISTLISYSYGNLALDYYRLYVLSAYQLISKIQTLEVVNQFKLADMNTLVSALDSQKDVEKTRKEILDELLKHTIYKAILNQFNLEVEEKGKFNIVDILKKIESKDLKSIGQILFFAIQSKSYQNQSFDLMNYIIKVLNQRSYLSTWEQAWVVIAVAKAKDLFNGSQSWKVSYQGDLIEGMKIHQKEVLGQKASVKQVFKNESNHPIWLQVQGTGVKQTQPSLKSSALKLSDAQYFNRLGEPIALKNGELNVKAGDELLVKINFEMPSTNMPLDDDLIIKSLLPAGWRLMENKTFTYMLQTYEAQKLGQRVDLPGNKYASRNAPNRPTNTDNEKDEEDQELLREELTATDPLLKHQCVALEEIKAVDKISYVLKMSQSPYIDQDRKKIYCSLIYGIKNTIPGRYIIPGLEADFVNDPELRATTTSRWLNVE